MLMYGCTVKCVNKAIRQNYFPVKIRNVRFESCIYQFQNGEVWNVLCYISSVMLWSLIIVVVQFLFAIVLLGPCFLWKEYFKSQTVDLSSTSALMEQRKSFIWNQVIAISRRNNVSYFIHQLTNTILPVAFIIVSCLY